MYALLRFFPLFVLFSWLGWLAHWADASSGDAPFNKEISVRALPPDSLPPDSLDRPYEPSRRPVYDPEDRYGDPFSTPPVNTPLILDLPGGITPSLEIDDSLQTYDVDEDYGELDYRPPSEMSFEEFQEYRRRQLLQNYFRERSAALDGESAVEGRGLIPKIYISPALDRIFGGNFVDIRPNGQVLLDFGGQFQRVDNPALPIRQQRNGTFLFDQQISMNIVGKVGEKLQLNVNWDTQASFDFENNIRLEYTGYDHEVIQKIEAGNVSLPISSSLITGAQNLFGIKAQLQFGRWSVTGLASTQRGKSESVSLQGGAQRREFEIRVDEYDENRHFFLSHFFRQNYERWLQRTPVITSGVNITRVEIYLTNRSNETTNLRNVVGLLDLGETDSIFRDVLVQQNAAAGAPTANGNNDLFGSLRGDANFRNSQTTVTDLDARGFVNNTDYSFIKSARQLEEGRDFIFHRQLGYVSLVTPLRNDDVLAVSYEYTYQGRTFKVGELVEDYQGLGETQTVMMKLLRPATIQRRIPTWDLMMKNIYNLNASQISPENFQLRIIYKDDATGVDNPSLNEGAIKDQPLLQVFNLDRLNLANELQVDGNFDFVEGITIQPENGRIIFPILEPFGSFLAARLGPPDQPATQRLIDKYAFTALYDSTRSDAWLSSDKNKFFLTGSLQSSSSNEIILPGINIARGSVVVTAGGIPLVEGQDYQVNYDLGRVTILNQGVLSSNQEVDVRYEKADLFNFQQRSLFGTRTEYQVSDDVVFGGTLLHLNERPVISRVSIGDEPTKNTIWGLDVNLRRESRLLTRAIDKLPVIQTKAPSTINFYGEVAQLRPGASRALDPDRQDRSGRSYVDDFEGAETGYRIGNLPQNWMLAATPASAFPAAARTPNLPFAYQRARLAWYTIDQLFYIDGGTRQRPPGITEADMRNHYVRRVDQFEIFEGRDREVFNLPLPTFDVAYYPEERGPYNYNPNLLPDGSLPNPEQNWGGITQAINFDTDFDNANVQYLEFWLLNPFIPDSLGRVDDGRGPAANNTTGGRLFINLGSVSEDVLKDNLHAFENGLPTPERPGANVATSAWGNIT
ncbi:MAG: cell surface protein SprA, partial [Catalinimonas sp.]